MIRPQFHRVLGQVVHARIELDGLKEAVIDDMRKGWRPTYRGHPWGQDHFLAIELLTVALDTAFDICKWIQFPEVAGFRQRLILDRLKEITDDIGTTPRSLHLPDIR